MAKDIGLSEARRRLPALVRRIASEGGRIDISYRGKPQASLLRVSDVKAAPATLTAGASLHPALRIELDVPGGDLVAAIRAIRSEQGQPRDGWLAESRPTRKRKPQKALPRRSR